MKRLAILFLILPMAANAGLITTFTDRSLFESAAGGSLTVEDFTDTAHFPLVSGVLNSDTTDAGLVPGEIEEGVTYSTPIGTGNFFNIDLGGQYSGGFLDGFNPSDRDVTIVFDEPVSAFGFDIGGLGSVTFDVLISFSAGPDQLFQNDYPDSVSLFGWVSDQADISSVIVGNDGGFFGFDFDNFTFGGEVATVPEPSTLALLGIGLLGIGFARRRRT
jgi:hypothetical protein